MKSATVTRTDVYGFVEGSVSGGCGRLRCRDQVIVIPGVGRRWSVPEKCFQGHQGQVPVEDAGVARANEVAL